MLIWQAEDVVRGTRGHGLHEQNWVAHGVAIDSRAVRAGDLFIALQGPEHDAHNYVAQAFTNGAVAAIVQRKPPQVPADAPLLFVEDTFVALQDLGRVGRARAKARIVAVTGSVGKTSSKDMLRLMLEAMGDTYANEGSFNNHWGVPLSLARLPQEAHYGVFEIGMNHAGELGPLSREVQPHVALITNIEAVHLEFFASVEVIADAKAEIFLGMDPEGIAILNRDNPYYARLLAAARTQGLKRTLAFGRDSKCDARLLECTTNEDGSMVTAMILGKTLTYQIGVPGSHIAFNSLGTLLAAAMAGGDLELCAAALAHYQLPKGRGTRHTVQMAGGSFILTDESYNASPVATQAAIKVLSQTPVGPGGRRIAALGDMRELGATAPALHAALAADLVAANIDVVHCCGPMMAHLYQALPPALRGHYAVDSATLAPLVAADIQAGDAIMVKGSKSILMPHVVNALKALAQDSQMPRKISG